MGGAGKRSGGRCCRGVAWNHQKGVPAFIIKSSHRSWDLWSTHHCLALDLSILLYRSNSSFPTLHLFKLNYSLQLHQTDYSSVHITSIKTALKWAIIISWDTVISFLPTVVYSEGQQPLDLLCPGLSTHIPFLYMYSSRIWASDMVPVDYKVCGGQIDLDFCGHLPPPSV